jgi:hypothetical protein
MKKAVIFTAAAVLSLFIVGVMLTRFRPATQNANAYSISVELLGSTNAAFSGHYMRAGERVPISGVLPWGFAESNVTYLEVRKVRPEDMLMIDVRGGGSLISAPAGPGSHGLRVVMEGGWRFELIK